MNKYQEALAYLKNRKDPSKITDSVIALAVIYGNMDEAYETLQELVDKATPMKSIQKIDSSHGEIVNFCPICGALNFDDKEYHTCWRCGQAIDWSDIDESK